MTEGIEVVKRYRQLISELVFERPVNPAVLLGSSLWVWRRTNALRVASYPRSCNVQNSVCTL